MNRTRVAVRHTSAARKSRYWRWLPILAALLTTFAFRASNGQSNGPTNDTDDVIAIADGKAAPIRFVVPRTLQGNVDVFVIRGLPRVGVVETAAGMPVGVGQPLDLANGSTLIFDPRGVWPVGDAGR